jgi:tetratricopeptide (TPR) repeat protein
VAWLFFAAPLLATLALAAPLAAQAPAAESKEQVADELFRRAKSQRALGRYADAASLLEASNRLSPGAGAYLLLGDSYERLGRLRSARDAFRQALQLAGARGDVDKEYQAKTREAALAPRLPHIEVRVAQPVPPGLLVTLNGIELSLGELNVPTALDAGRYRVAAQAPGYRPFSSDLQLSNDGSQPFGVHVVAIQLSPGEASQSLPGASRKALAAWVGGAGGALVLGAAISLFVALDKNSDSGAACGRAIAAPRDNENVCTEDGANLRREARTFAHFATAGTLLGIAGIGAGIGLYVTAGSDAAHETAEVRWSGNF